jgi:hypothetical protein
MITSGRHCRPDGAEEQAGRKSQPEQGLVGIDAWPAELARKLL